MRPHIPRKAFTLPLDALGVEIAYIQGHRTPRNRQGRIDLRYVVIMDIHYMDRIVRAEATELNAESMKDFGIANFRQRIEEYWDHHTVRPDTARDILAVKRPNDYRALWGRLPGNEAQALYILDMLGCLAYWRPGYIVTDILRVLNSLNDPPARRIDTPLGVRPALVQPQAPTEEEDSDLSDFFDFRSAAQGTT